MKTYYKGNVTSDEHGETRRNRRLTDAGKKKNATEGKEDRTTNARRGGRLVTKERESLFWCC